MKTVIKNINKKFFSAVLISSPDYFIAVTFASSITLLQITRR